MRRRIVRIELATTGFLAAPCAASTDYLFRTVRGIVPLAPSGGTDAN